MLWHTNSHVGNTWTKYSQEFLYGGDSTTMYVVIQLAKQDIVFPLSASEFLWRLCLHIERFSESVCLDTAN